MNKMRGGGKHRNKKNQVEKKQATSPQNREPVRDYQEPDEGKTTNNAELEHRQQEPKRDKRMLSRENAENEVIRHFEKTEETRKIIANLAKRSNSDIERWLQNCVKLSGLDDEQKETDANGIRRAVKQAAMAHEESQPQHRSKARQCVSRHMRCKKRENGRRKF